MNPLLPPTHEDATTRSWAFGDESLTVTRRGSLWLVQRPGAHTPLATRQEPSVHVRLGRGDAAAHLVHPMSIAANANIEIWLAWPLEVVVLADDDQVDAWRPHLRRTLLGPVESGRVLPAAVCALLEGPRTDLPMTQVALRVRVINRASDRVILRRVPIEEHALSLAQAGSHLAAGSVHVTLFETERGLARVQPFTPPDGFEVVHSPPAQPHHPHLGGLDWLLDATRRSTEFQY